MSDSLFQVRAFRVPSDSNSKFNSNTLDPTINPVFFLQQKQDLGEGNKLSANSDEMLIKRLQMLLIDFSIQSKHRGHTWAFCNSKLSVWPLFFLFILKGLKGLKTSENMIPKKNDSLVKVEAFCW